MCVVIPAKSCIFANKLFENMKVGDIVRFLNAVGGGKVTKIEGNIAYVEEPDGFETPVMVR